MQTGARYQQHPGLVLAFHGTDKSIADQVFAGKAELQVVPKPYDWLGHGIYFWEYSPARAMAFAQEKKKRGEIKTPAVIGAVIAPGTCLNLLEASALEELKIAYTIVKADAQASGNAIPKNAGGEDLLLRHLDCAVVEMACELRALTGSGPLAAVSGIQPLLAYDTVRGAFWEGKLLYDNAGFREKNHVQLCVRNPRCIKGYFRILPD